MSRHFRIEQAERLLPEVENEVRIAVTLKSQYDDAEAELESIARHVMMSGGAQVDRGQLTKLKVRRDALAARLKEAVETIQQYGCLIKDLDMGLVDFPTRLRGQEVYLCWKLGESQIEFWHGVDEGYRGRKRINQDFLDNHEGDAAS